MNWYRRSPLGTVRSPWQPSITPGVAPTAQIGLLARTATISCFRRPRRRRVPATHCTSPQWRAVAGVSKRDRALLSCRDSHPQNGDDVLDFPEVAVMGGERKLFKSRDACVNQIGPA